MKKVMFLLISLSNLMSISAQKISGQFIEYIYTNSPENEEIFKRNITTNNVFNTSLKPINDNELELLKETAERANHLFYDSFESYQDFSTGGISASNNKGNIGQWLLIDQDGYTTNEFPNATYPNSGEQMSYIIFNAKNANLNSNKNHWEGRTGNKAMISFSSKYAKNNDWLISPNIKLGNSDNVLTFYTKAGDIDFGYEEFRVLVSTTDSNLSSFKEISREILDSKNQFIEYKYDLSAYNGQEIFIAIQSLSNYQFGFIVDDFRIDGNTTDIDSNDNIKTITTIHQNNTENKLKINFSSEADLDNLKIDLYNMNGFKMYSFKKSDYYDISSLPAETYVIEINDGKTRTMKKITKK